MNDDRVKLSFDSEYKLRVFDETKCVRSDELEKESGGFAEKISSFNEKVSGLVEILELHATRIEKQKLRAIGLRMAKEAEEDRRHGQQKAMQAIINEKKAELDRYTAQYKSLERIEAEQRALLEKLSNTN